MANDAERALRERDKRLGYRIQRRGIDYRLITMLRPRRLAFRTSTALICGSM
jgi:hypothetical protein